MLSFCGLSTAFFLILRSRTQLIFILSCIGKHALPARCAAGPLAAGELFRVPSSALLTSLCSYATVRPVGFNRVALSRRQIEEHGRCITKSVEDIHAYEASVASSKATCGLVRLLPLVSGITTVTFSDVQPQYWRF